MTHSIKYNEELRDKKNLVEAILETESALLRTFWATISRYLIGRIVNAAQE